MLMPSTHVDVSIHPVQPNPLLLLLVMRMLVFTHRVAYSPIAIASIICYTAHHATKKIQEPIHLDLDHSPMPIMPLLPINDQEPCPLSIPDEPFPLRPMKPRLFAVHYKGCPRPCLSSCCLTACCY